MTKEPPACNAEPQLLSNWGKTPTPSKRLRKITSFGRFIDEQRIRQGMSLETLFTKAGYHPNQLQYWAEDQSRVKHQAIVELLQVLGFRLTIKIERIE
jgi:ribosome-binding protein aMBF1 (putative translation factor)